MVEGDDDDVGQVVGVAVELELVQRVAYVALCDQAKKKERIKKEAKRCRAIKRKKEAGFAEERAISLCGLFVSPGPRI